MNEITNQDIMDMLSVLIERTERISKVEEKLNKVDEYVRGIDLKLEMKIEPTIQAIFENQAEIINQKVKVDVLDKKHDELNDRVDVIEYAVKKNQNEIEKLKHA